MELSDLIKKAKDVRAKYAELEKKKYGREWTSAEIYQGFVGDVGDLGKLIMAKEGIREQKNIDEELAHEMADCLWSVLILADKLGVDIEKSYLETLSRLEKRIENESR